MGSQDAEGDAKSAIASSKAASRTCAILVYNVRLRYIRRLLSPMQSILQSIEKDEDTNIGVTERPKLPLKKANRPHLNLRVDTRANSFAANAPEPVPSQETTAAQKPLTALQKLNEMSKRVGQEEEDVEMQDRESSSSSGSS